MSTATPTLTQLDQIEAGLYDVVESGRVGIDTWAATKFPAVARDLKAMAHGGPYDPEDPETRAMVLYANRGDLEDAERRCLVRAMMTETDMGSPVSTDELRAMHRGSWATRRAATDQAARITCQALDLCNDVAVATVEHPTRGTVPVCARCQ